jgi:alpha-amylase/alpha-mannosidase (GH57 family)
MNRSKVADLSEILSSIAIVVTLIYVTIEIGQNTAAIRTQTAQSILEAGQSELMAFIEHPDIALGIAMTGPLTPEQNVKLDAFLANAMRSREFAWLQYKNNTLGEASWNGEAAVLSVYLDSSRIRTWWDKLGRHYMDSEFVQFVDLMIEEKPATDELWTTTIDWTSQ